MTRQDVLDRIRPHAGEFRAAGLEALYLFGSIARNEAGVHSDVDLACDLDLSRGMDLFDFIGLKLKLEDLLGARTDLVARTALCPRVKAAAEAEMVRVF